jgi:hypothetical protein
LVALTLLLGPVPALADRVIDSGFCRRVSGPRCLEPLDDGAEIPVASLERDRNGRRLIYFFTVIEAEHARFFVQSIGRGAQQAEPPLEATVHSSAPLPESVQRVTRAFRVDDRADVLNVVVPIASGTPTYRAVAVRYVRGPGPMAAKVVDPEGNDFDGSQLTRIEIVP